MFFVQILVWAYSAKSLLDCAKLPQSCQADPLPIELELTLMYNSKPAIGRHKMFGQLLLVGQFVCFLVRFMLYLSSSFPSQLAASIELQGCVSKTNSQGIVSEGTFYV